MKVFRFAIFVAILVFPFGGMVSAQESEWIGPDSGPACCYDENAEFAVRTGYTSDMFMSEITGRAVYHSGSFSFGMGTHQVVFEAYDPDCSNLFDMTKPVTIKGMEYQINWGTQPHDDLPYGETPGSYVENVCSVTFTLLV